MAKRKKRKSHKSKYVKRYALAGMYDDNTVGAAGQGGIGSTSNIVFDESNPTVLQNKLDFLKNIKEQSTQESNAMATEIENQKIQEEQAISDAAAADAARFTKAESLVKTGADQTTKLVNKSKPWFDKLKTGYTEKDAQAVSKFMKPSLEKSIFNAQLNKSVTDLSKASLTVPDSSRLTLSGLPAKDPMSHLNLGADKLSSGLDTFTPDPNFMKPLGSSLTSTTDDVLSTAKPYDLSNITVDGQSAGGGIKSAIKAYKAQRATNKAIKAGELMQSSAGTGASAGWKALSAGSKANIIGTASKVVGEGIKHFGGDEDETDLNTAEWAGESLSGIGTGIGAVSTLGTILGAMGAGASGGSVIPLWGTIAGATAGLGYGLYKAISGRNKARKAEKEMKAERAQKVGKHNTELKSKVFSALAGARAGEVEQKTYSGYDLGRNVDISKYGGFNFRNGGMKMGVPRYGFKPA